jgi:hypothetical protein
MFRTTPGSVDLLDPDGNVVIAGALVHSGPDRAWQRLASLAALAIGEQTTPPAAWPGRPAAARRLTGEPPAPVPSRRPAWLLQSEASNRRGGGIRAVVGR